MTLKGEPENFPRMEGQQADVVPGSPLAVLAVFTELVRERFRPANALSWVWSENPTPAAAETNDPGAATGRKLLVEPAFNVNTEVRNYRPAIFIDKGESVSGKVVVGNLAGQRIQSGMRAFYSHVTIPIDIECVSDQRGESAQLGDITWFYLLAGREQIRAAFGFQDITNPTLSKTYPFEADKPAWTTHINFEVVLPLRWTTLPISPMLKDIVMRYRSSGETNPDTFFLKQYIP